MWGKVKYYNAWYRYMYEQVFWEFFLYGSYMTNKADDNGSTQYCIQHGSSSLPFQVAENNGKTRNIFFIKLLCLCKVLSNWIKKMVTNPFIWSLMFDVYMELHSHAKNASYDTVCSSIRASFSMFLVFLCCMGL